MKTKNAKKYAHAGMNLSLREWAERLEIKEITLRKRIEAGWPLSKVLGQPLVKEKSATPRMLLLGGKNQSMSKWARETGISVGTITRRLNKGWDVEKALTTPAAESAKVYTIFGKSHTLREWSDINGISVATLQGRINQGWDIEKALTTDLCATNMPKKVWYDGECHSIAGWGRIVGQSRAMLSRRLSSGWDVGEALTAPLVCPGNTKKRSFAA